MWWNSRYGLTTDASMKKQIYLFTENGIAASYGVGAYISLLANLLKEETDFDIAVVELLSDKKEVVDTEVDGIRYLYIPKAENRIKRNYYRNVFYILHRYILIKKELIFHLNFMSCKKMAAMLRCYYPQAKIILTIHYSVCGMMGLVDHRIEEDEKEFVNKYCDTVIALSNHRYHFLVDKYKLSSDKIEIIPHGIPDSYVGGFKRGLDIRRQLGLGNEKIILYVGRLDENKGIDLLVRAFRMVAEHLSDVHLVVVGEGVLLPFALQACRGLWGKTTFTGFLQKEDIYQLYADASMGVIPSRYEELGFVALEMMMFGLPVIANESTGLSDIFCDSKAGQLVRLDYEDKQVAAELLAGAMMKLLEDEKLQRLYKMNARNCYLKNYTIETFKKRMLAIYRN